jgi:hypothetical protein
VPQVHALLSLPTLLMLLFLLKMVWHQKIVLSLGPILATDDAAAAADGSSHAEPPKIVAVSDAVIAVDGGASTEPHTVVTVSDEAVADDGGTSAKDSMPLLFQGDGDGQARSGSGAIVDEESSKKDASEDDEEASKNGDAMEDVMQPVSHHQPIP